MLESVVGTICLTGVRRSVTTGITACFCRRCLRRDFPGRERMAEMLEMASKNLPGSVAADFEFIDRGDGKAAQAVGFARQGGVADVL